jgi:hypothetical protein
LDWRSITAKCVRQKSKFGNSNVTAKKGSVEVGVACLKGNH